MISVSTLIPGEDSDQFLLCQYRKQGFWFPTEEVGKTETIQLAAQRVASEVWIACFNSVYFNRTKWHCQCCDKVKFLD